MPAYASSPPRPASTPPARVVGAAVLLLTIGTLKAARIPQQTMQLKIVCQERVSQLCWTWPLAAGDVQLAERRLHRAPPQYLCGISDSTETLDHMEIFVSFPGNEVTAATCKRKIQLPMHNLNDWNLEYRKGSRQRRQVSHRGRFRGQTQSQYLAIDQGANKDEGKAEAISAADTSKAVVSGRSGMGQAQSQSMYDPSCDECVDRYVPGTESLRRPSGGNKGNADDGPGGGGTNGGDSWNKPDRHRGTPGDRSNWNSQSGGPGGPTGNKWNNQGQDGTPGGRGGTQRGPGRQGEGLDWHDGKPSSTTDEGNNWNTQGRGPGGQPVGPGGPDGHGSSLSGGENRKTPGGTSDNHGEGSIGHGRPGQVNNWNTQGGIPGSQDGRPDMKGNPAGSGNIWNIPQGHPGSPGEINNWDQQGGRPGAKGPGGTTNWSTPGGSSGGRPAGGNNWNTQGNTPSNNWNLQGKAPDQAPDGETNWNTPGGATGGRPGDVNNWNSEDGGPSRQGPPNTWNAPTGTENGERGERGGRPGDSSSWNSQNQPPGEMRGPSTAGVNWDKPGTGYWPPFLAKDWSLLTGAVPGAPQGSTYFCCVVGPNPSQYIGTGGGGSGMNGNTGQTIFNMEPNGQGSGWNGQGRGPGSQAGSSGHGGPLGGGWNGSGSGPANQGVGSGGHGSPSGGGWNGQGGGLGNQGGIWNEQGGGPASQGGASDGQGGPSGGGWNGQAGGPGAQGGGTGGQGSPSGGGWNGQGGGPGSQRGSSDGQVGPSEGGWNGQAGGPGGQGGGPGGQGSPSGGGWNGQGGGPGSQGGGPGGQGSTLGGGWKGQGGPGSQGGGWRGQGGGPGNQEGGPGSHGGWNGQGSRPGSQGGGWNRQGGPAREGGGTGGQGRPSGGWNEQGGGPDSQGGGPSNQGSDSGGQGDPSGGGWNGQGGGPGSQGGGWNVQGGGPGRQGGGLDGQGGPSGGGWNGQGGGPGSQGGGWNGQGGGSGGQGGPSGGWNGQGGGPGSQGGGWNGQGGGPGSQGGGLGGQSGPSGGGWNGQGGGPGSQGGGWNGQGGGSGGQGGPSGGWNGQGGGPGSQGGGWKGQRGGPGTQGRDWNGQAGGPGSQESGLGAQGGPSGGGWNGQGRGPDSQGGERNGQGGPGSQGSSSSGQGGPPGAGWNGEGGPGSQGGGWNGQGGAPGSQGGPSGGGRNGQAGGPGGQEGKTGGQGGPSGGGWNGQGGGPGTQGGNEQIVPGTTGRHVPPQNVIDPNSIPAEEEDSQAESSITQNANGTMAIASSNGGNDKGRAKTQVSGTYAGSGTFSAQAEISDESKGAQSEVSGGKHGAISIAQGHSRNSKSQANVNLGSETGSLTSGAQSDGVMHSSNTQVQGGVKGGSAEAQARGPGSTSSQAQIGFTPFKDTDRARHDLFKTPFVGAGKASSHSNGRIGESQSQLEGTFQYGIKYTGAAQSGASLDKDAVFASRLPFNKIDVFDKSDVNINVDNTETPPMATPLPLPDINDVENNVANITERPQDNPGERLNGHTHLDHHMPGNENKAVPLSPPPAGNTRSFQPPYVNNNADFDYTSDKEDNPSEDYDADGGFEPEGTDAMDGEYNYEDFGKDSETHQSLHTPSRKSFEFKQSSGGNTQHIVLGALHGQDAIITQQNTDQRPDEARIYQPGESVPGTGGYIIPVGFTGSVKSVASKQNTYAIGTRRSPSQAQTISLTPGSGKVKYVYPNRNVTPYGKYVAPKDLRSYTNNNKDDGNRYVSVSKTVTGALDNENNIRKQYSHTYYTKSSSCGYFTFTCTMVSGPDGRKKVCKPKIPTNPDGTPMRC